MQVKVKEDARFNVITACGGMTFFKNAETPVDESFRSEIENNSYLEILVGEASPLSPFEGKIGATDGAVALAVDSGIDLAGVVGTGAKGRIVVGDIRAVIKSNIEESMVEPSDEEVPEIMEDA